MSKKIIQRLTYLPKNYKTLNISQKFTLIEGLTQQKIASSEYTQEEIKRVFNPKLNKSIKTNTISKEEKNEIDTVLDLIQSNKEANGEIDEDIELIIESLNHKKGGKKKRKSKRKITRKRKTRKIKSGSNVDVDVEGNELQVFLNELDNIEDERSELKKKERLEIEEIKKNNDDVHKMGTKDDKKELNEEIKEIKKKYASKFNELDERTEKLHEKYEMI